MRVSGSEQALSLVSDAGLLRAIHADSASLGTASPETGSGSCFPPPHPAGAGTVQENSPEQEPGPGVLVLPLPPTCSNPQAKCLSFSSYVKTEGWTCWALSLPHSVDSKGSDLHLIGLGRGQAHGLGERDNPQGGTPSRKPHRPIYKSARVPGKSRCSQQRQCCLTSATQSDGVARYAPSAKGGVGR